MSSFAEQNLVGRNSAFERKLAMLYTAGYAALIALAVALSVYWLVGLQESLDTIEEVDEIAERLEIRLGEANQARTLANILPALDTARELRNEVKLPPGYSYYGFLSVDARPPMAKPAAETYDNVLKRYLLPTLTSQLGAKVEILSAAADTNSLLLREQLATYLMLTTTKNFDRTKVEREFDLQSETAFMINPDRRTKMDRHIDSLVSLLPSAIASNNATVLAARTRLSETPQAADIYQRMVSDSERRYQLPRVSMINVVGRGVLRLDTAARGGRSVIPGIYTKNGFNNFFLPRLPEYIRSSTGTDWVLNNSTISNETYNQVAREITALYVRDYIAAWRDAINQVRIIDFETLNRGQTVLQELSEPQSPLTKLLIALRDNTELPLPGTNEPNTAAPTAAVNPVGAVASSATSAADALQRTAVSSSLGDAPWPGIEIQEAFKPLTALVDPDNPQGSIETIQQLFGDLFGSVYSVATAPQPEAAAFELVVQRAKSPTSDSFTKLQTEAVTKPEPVRSMVTYVANRNWQLMMRLSYDHLNALWQQEVLPVCDSIMADRYPFSQSAKTDVSLQDFSDLFKPAGIIDTFFKDHLSPFLKFSGRRLVETKIQGTSLGFSGETLAQFSRAQFIRNAFFGAAGTTPSAKFTIEPTFLDPKALKSTLTLDDIDIVYRHGPLRAKDFEWPSNLDASVARLRITLLDGTSEVVERKGTWAIFRILSASGLSKSRGQDGFVFSIRKDDVKASFRLQASSVTNPFNLGAISAFRCPPAL